MQDKMMMVVYNEAIDSDVMETLKECGLTNYTKIVATYGKGTTSGTHLGDDIWPGRNNILFIACEKNQKDALMSRIRELRKALGKEGIKTFSLPLEELT